MAFADLRAPPPAGLHEHAEYTVGWHFPWVPHPAMRPSCLPPLPLSASPPTPCCCASRWRAAAAAVSSTSFPSRRAAASWRRPTGAAAAATAAAGAVAAAAAAAGLCLLPDCLPAARFVGVRLDSFWLAGSMLPGDACRHAALWLQPSQSLCQGYYVCIIPLALLIAGPPPPWGCRLFERDGVQVVCDDISLEFLKGSTGEPSI